MRFYAEIKYYSHTIMTSKMVELTAVSKFGVSY